MQLRKLSLTNFQDHYQTTFVFGSTFNCIIGATNSGKSSLARALTFLLYGDWIDDYISHGTDSATVMAEFNNGVSIARIKGTENTLILKNGTEEFKLDKIGRTLPTQFYSLLQLSPIQLDVDKELYLTVANQDDPYFLLAETGPVRNKVLGKLAGLHIADRAIGSLKTDRKALSTEKTHLTGQLLDAENQLQAFVQLSRQQNLLTTLQTKVQHIQDKESQLQQLYTLKEKIKDWKRRKEDLQFLRLRATIPNTDTVTEFVTKWQKLKVYHTQLQVNETDIALVQQQKETVKQQHMILKEEYKKELLNIGQCPLCDTKLTTQIVERATSKL
jgi:DNA repair exonuclease SbcCD ATPase subunit